jgi:hypothetical protein
MKIFLNFAAALGALTLGSVACGQTWRTGAEFRKQLETNISISWSSNPLRSALSRLSEQQRLAVFLDRRVDPGQRIDFSVTGAAVDEALQRLAASRSLGVCYVGSVIYFGPPPTTAALPTVAALRRDEMARASRGASASALTARPLSWDDLTTPRELMEQTAVDAGLTLVNMDRIPHDLWAAGELPAQHLAERLTVLLAGFELSFRIVDASRVEIVAWDAPAPIVRHYSVSGDAASAADQIAKLFPSAQVRAHGGDLEVSAYAEEHEAIARLLRGERVRRRTAVAAETRYSLKMESAPVGPLLKSLGPRLNLQVEFDPSIADKLQSPVTFDVKDATLEELLDAIVEPARLAWRRDGETLRIVPLGPGADPSPR